MAVSTTHRRPRHVAAIVAVALLGLLGAGLVGAQGAVAAQPAQDAGDPWWSTTHDHRLPIAFTPAGGSIEDRTVLVDLDATPVLAGSHLELDSLRLVEVDGTGDVTDPAVPFQFSPAADYDGTNNPSGTLAVLVRGATADATTRSYHLYLDDSTGTDHAPAPVVAQVERPVLVDDEGLDAYRIETPAGTWAYHVDGGGFSSLDDVDGNDWISWSPAGGSAGEYRGIPNLVYPEGHFRPGGTSSTTTVVHDGPLTTRLRSTTADGWAMEWDIFATHATGTVLSAPDDYWFLYEGTPGGELDEVTDTVTRSGEMTTSTGESWTEDLDDPEWAAFTDTTLDRSLFVAAHQPDAFTDSYRPMQDRMTVFGLGRSGITPTLSGADRSFSVGLVDDRDIDVARTSATTPVDATTGPSEDRPVPSSSPVARIVTAATTGHAPAVVSLDASTSTATEGSLATFDWDLGDGAQATGSQVSHTFNEPGTYEVTLTVTDDAGRTATDHEAVVVTGTEPSDTTAPNISAVYVTPSTSSATISWDTDEPADSRLDVGTTDAYGADVVDTTLTTVHELEVTGLQPATTYHYRLTSADADGNETATADATFTTSATAPGGAVVGSDDFSAGLDTGRWTVVDPIGDGTVTATGQGTSDAVVSLSVPAGTSHDPWGSNRSLRIMQDVADADFTAEVKFDSLPSQRYQNQGLIVEQDDADWLRFDVYSTGNSIRAFAASTTNNSSRSRLSQTIDPSGSVWIRVARAGDTWTMSWSDDGTNFSEVGSFTTGLTVNAVGPFASNHNPSPAFTANVDYVFDTTDPIDPEDPTGPDTTAPTITGVTVDAATDAATVTWTTNEAADSTVDYGTTAAHGDTATDDTLTTSHSLDLTGLQPETTYHYQVTSTDPAGNTTTSPDATFTTPAEAPTTWTLTTDTDGQGTVTTDPAGPTHPDGTTVTLTATPATGWTFTGWTGDLDTTDNPTTITLDADTTTTATFQQDEPAPGGAVVGSDDFSAGLDTGRWTVVDPIGDGTVTATGQGTSDAVVSLSVPAGTSHDPWGSNRSLRIMQDVADADFTAEVKFDSLPSQRYQNQGLIVEQDDADWLRFDVYSTGNSIRAFAASTTNNSSRSRLSQTIDPSGSVWIRVARAGDTWTMSWSDDGTNFSEVGSFTTGLTVNAVGPFASNHNPSPAFTANVDYVFDTTDPIDPEDPTGPDTTAPTITGVTVDAATDAATVTWTTNEAADSTVDYGTTAAHGDTATDDTLTTSHSLDLTGLQPETTYHYQVTSTDPAGNTTTSPDATFTTPAEAPTTWTLTTDTDGQGTVTTDPAGPTHPDGTTVTLTATPATGWTFTGWTGDLDTTDNPTTITLDADTTTTATFQQDEPSTNPLQADEFAGTSLNTELWRFVDPKGDGSQSVSEGALHLGVPAGSTHDLWRGSNDVVRVVQDVPDADVDLEVGFDSTVAAEYQLQGIIAQQDQDNWVRFDVYHTGSTTNLFAATTTNAATTVRRNTAIPDGPVRLRMERAGDTWTLSYSHDGQSWTVGTEFTHAMVLAEVGPYAGNAGPSPAFTADVDYVRPVVADETPPTIDALAVDAQLTSAEVTFTTNEAATTQLRWGTDTSYDLGTATGDDPISEHALTATGLDCGTAHPFEVTATDVAGNPATSTGTITTLDCPPPDETAPVLSGLDVQTTTSTASVSVTSDEPATATLSWGPSPAELDDSTTGEALVTDHLVVADGLACEASFAWELAVSDNSGNTATEEGTFTTGDCPEGVTSDDFSSASLDTGLWSFVDPLGDSQLTMTGTNAVFHVPKGQPHQMWSGSDHAPRLLQAAPDTDFELELKVETPIELRSQGVGLLVETNDQERLVFEFAHSTYPRLYVSNTAGGSSSKVTEKALSDGEAPLYLRINRQGDTWTASYSDDGQTWTVGTTFDRPIEVRTIGVFASNSHPQATATPAHVASIDYVMNTAAPITPEDGGQPPVEGTAPAVDVWYGDDQTFGQDGQPQRWVNVVGNVADDDGIASLRYRLNDGDSRGLLRGPGDIRDPNARLTAPGDFNVDINYDDLQDGDNTVVITAIDTRADRTEQVVTVTKVDGTSPTLPHEIDWSGGLADVQVVDGRWTMTDDGVRTAEPGYDRLLTVGDQAWTDYEVVAPITFHEFGDPAVQPAAGIIVGWDGHDTTFGQPWVGHPFGGLGWYQEVSGGRLQVVGKGGKQLGANQGYDLDLGTTHMFKVQVEQESATTSAYRLKVWPQGGAEPNDWNIDVDLPFRAGSPALVAHHADVTFGDVSITEPVTEPITIDDVTVEPSQSSATVTWTTNVPTSSSVSFGTTSAHELGAVEDSEPVTDHSITLDGLALDTEYHFGVSSSDANGATATTGDATFRTLPPESAFVGPEIEVWYGDTQVVGAPAVAQQWANVLGNVHDEDGVDSLTYSLNGGPAQSLNLGPDLRRLAHPGDFTVEIDHADLVAGDNTVELLATDTYGAETSRTVTLSYQPQTAALPLPYAMDWSSPDPFQRAHVVDGLWEVSNGGATTVELGYDRTIAIGDIQWQDYEVEVPVTVRSLGPDSGTPQSGEPLVGLGLRWQGHAGTAQPRVDFYPTGAYAWHRWRFNGRFELLGNDGSPLVREDEPMTFGVTYIFKAQVQTTPAGDEYRFKYWPQGETEPTDWSLDIVEDDGNANGSVLLIAHHVDATFGTVEVRPLPS